MIPVLTTLLCLAPAAAPDDEFAAVWYDGRAELSGYRWRGTRYGELRSGEAVAIFVTEPFGARSHVKIDRPGETDEEVVTALKLNLVRDFPTGIYDYDTMVSCFVRADDFSLMKLTFTGAEWCGHVYEELDARPGATVLDLHSYFQGESTRRELEAPAGGLVGEQLLVWLRGLRGAVLAPGETRTVPFLAGPFERRLRHAAASWGRARVTRAKEAGRVEVPAGTFAALTYRVEAPDGRKGHFAYEAAYPHRLLSWEWTRGGEVLDAGELLGSARLPYWELHGEGQERLRARLGFQR